MAEGATRYNKPDTNIVEIPTVTAKIRAKEEQIAALLSPVESYILVVQRILVWDLPYASFVLFIAVHVLLWLSTTVRFYCLCGVTCMILIVVDLCILHILTQNFDNDASSNGFQSSWTELHPNFLGVPELSHLLAKVWVTCLNVLDSAIMMRTSNHPKFFVSSILYLGAAAVFGAYIPGIWLAYLTVMGLMLWPCLKYHRVLERFETAAMPFVHRVEHKLNIKRKRRRTNKKEGRKRQTQQSVEFDDEDSSDDQILEEFVPSVNPVVMTTLTSALSNEMIWDDDDDEDLLIGHTSSGRLTPVNHTHDLSDDDILGDELSSLAYGLGAEMPSINDVDGSIFDLPDRIGDASLDPDDALIDSALDDRGTSLPATNIPLQRPANDFDADDSDADEASLAEGLTFSDEFTETFDGHVTVGDSIGGTILSNFLSQGHSKLSAALSSSTLSGIVSGASLGLGAIRDAVRRGSVTVALTSSAEDVQNDSDILDAEFEFLDREELE